MGATNYHTLYGAGPVACLNEEDFLFKNPLCPYYGECLERAVDAGWPQFTCLYCSCRDLHLALMPGAKEMEGHYRLLARIFATK